MRRRLPGPRRVLRDRCAATLNWSRDVSSLDRASPSTTAILYVTDDTGAVHALDKATGASAWKQDKLAARRRRRTRRSSATTSRSSIREGYVYLLDRSDGKLVGRAPTDGTPATAQPPQSGDNAVWQSARRDALSPSTGRK